MTTKDTSQSTGRMTVERCTDPRRWDSFVADNDGPAYALWGWGDAIESYGIDRRYLVARDDDGIAGALPLFHMESRLFGSRLVSLPFSARGSVVAGDGGRESAVDQLLDRTRELADDLGVDFVSLRGADLGERPAFERRNRFVTYRLPLGDGPDDVWETLQSNRRRQIGQAADEGLEYRAGTSLDELRDYYRLHLLSMREHGTPPHSFGFFRTLWERLAGEGHLHLGLLYKDGEPINGILDFSLGSTVYQWGVVNDYEYRDLNGGSLLLWKSLERASEEGYDAYEFGRTREGSGVYLFKKSFGGEKVWYDDYHYFPNGTSTLPDPEDGTYEPAKRIWRRLPIPLTRLVGPAIRREISL